MFKGNPQNVTAIKTPNERLIEFVKKTGDMDTAYSLIKDPTMLSLLNKNIGDIGEDELAEILQDNSTLTSLDLGGNKIGIEGAKKYLKCLKLTLLLPRLFLETITWVILK